ncbi:MAG: alpha/beta fold hydrolase [Opitutae bacterium]
MKYFHLGGFLLGLAAFVPGHAGESIVAITPELKGAWVVPDAAWDGRTVLLLHGFASEMDEAGGFYKRLANALATHGMASLRINFRGEGDAARTKIESTFATRIADTEAAQAFVLRQPGADPTRLGLQGWSLGGATAIETGARHPDWFRSMVLWATLSGDQYAYMQEGIFRNALAQAAREGIASMEFNGWKTVTIRHDFFESFRGIDLDKSLAKYPGALLAIRGSDDFLPPHEAEFMKIAAARTLPPAPGAKIGPAEAVIIAGADHLFHVFEGEKGQSARVIELTVAWFARTL